MVVRMDSVVVLPAPFGPRSEKNSPASTANAQLPFIWECVDELLVPPAPPVRAVNTGNPRPKEAIGVWHHEY